jgi:hypothetical protein
LMSLVVCMPFGYCCCCCCCCCWFGSRLGYRGIVNRMRGKQY